MVKGRVACEPDFLFGNVSFYVPGVFFMSSICLLLHFDCSLITNTMTSLLLPSILFFLQAGIGLSHEVSCGGREIADSLFDEFGISSSRLLFFSGDSFPSCLK